MALAAYLYEGGVQSLLHVAAIALYTINHNYMYRRSGNFVLKIFRAKYFCGAKFS